MSTSFSFQPRKKNLFQKQKEQDDERKKRDEADAAQVYEEFVKDFGGASAGASTRRSSLPSHGQGRPAAATVAASVTEEPPRPISNSRVHTAHPHRGSKPRTIDLLLESLKRNEAERDSRREQGDEEAGGHREVAISGSHDTGDFSSTNLFVGNLAPGVDEQVLLREFGQFGPIASVKIMWPRDDEQRRRGKNTGFVAFMRRQDGEAARAAMDGASLHDMTLGVGWGMAVPLPATPIWPPPGGLALDAEKEHRARDARGASRDGRYGGRGTVEVFRGRQFVRPPAPLEEVECGVGEEVAVAAPVDPRQCFVIDAVVAFVLQDGCVFEQLIMEREAGNPEFAFLFNTASPEHLFYRWRLFALANGDSMRSWRVEPFQMVGESNRWVPPPMTLGRSGRTREAEGVVPGDGASLSDVARECWRGMLERLEPSREAVEAGMMWALTHAESAGCVSDMVSASAVATARRGDEEGAVAGGGDGATVPPPAVAARSLVAHLFLLSDILHNSAAQVKGASRYRSRLEESLPAVFEALAGFLRRGAGDGAAELLRRHVLRVLRVWKGWYIFGEDYVAGLQAGFLHGPFWPPGAAESPQGATCAERRDLSDQALQAKCRAQGLVAQGGREAMLVRLARLEAALQPRGRRLPGSREEQGEPGTRGEAANADTASAEKGGAAPEPAVASLSTWEPVDAEAEERQAQGAWHEVEVLDGEEPEAGVEVDAPNSSSRAGDGPTASRHSEDPRQPPRSSSRQASERKRSRSSETRDAREERRSRRSEGAEHASRLRASPEWRGSREDGDRPGHRRPLGDGECRPRDGREHWMRDQQECRGREETPRGDWRARDAPHHRARHLEESRTSCDRRGQRYNDARSRDQNR